MGTDDGVTAPRHRRLRVGISGWSYREWRHDFYAGVPQRRWLAHCAAHFTAIEVNVTFYRMMAESAFHRWRDETPDDFVFAVKGHKRITHSRRLADVDEPLTEVRRAFSNLGPKLAAVLWQLPPNLAKDADRLRAFAARLGAWRGVDHVVEFRHSSWFDDQTADILRHHGIANCLSDAPKWPLWDAVTSDLVYVRLHGASQLYVSAYGAAGLRPWVRRARDWLDAGRRVHVYFDNTMHGAATEDASRFLGMFAAAGGPAAS